LDNDWALLVVDLQNDFLDKRGYYGLRRLLELDATWRQLGPEAQALRLAAVSEDIPGGIVSAEAKKMLRNVTRAIERSRQFERPIAFVRAVYDRSFDVLPPGLHRDPERRHFPCRPGTWGVQFVDPIRLAVEQGHADRERVFDKHTYDPFFADTGLPAFLTEYDVRRLYVCGTETQTCVLATAQHAALLGYHTTILDDGVWSADQTLGDAALKMFARAFGEVCPVDAIGL
jgi:nicotinamidase-related amidase